MRRMIKVDIELLAQYMDEHTAVGRYLDDSGSYDDLADSYNAIETSSPIPRVLSATSEMDH